MDDSRTEKLVCFTHVQVAALVLEVRRVHARLGTLGEFNYRMSEEDIRLSWKTMDYPSVRFLPPDSAEVLPLRQISTFNRIQYVPAIHGKSALEDM